MESTRRTVRSADVGFWGRHEKVHRGSGAKGAETFLSWASWTFVALDPGEVLWDTGAQEGLIG